MVRVAPHAFPHQMEMCARTGTGSHMHIDYGRVDGFCMMDQRDFLQNVPPSERLLTFREKDACWAIQLGR